MARRPRTAKQKMSKLMAAARKLVTPEDLLKCYIDNHDNPDVPWEIRIKMKESLMDRGYGKAVASVEITALVGDDDEEGSDQDADGVLAGILMKQLNGQALTADEQALVESLRAGDAQKALPKMTIENADGSEVEPK
jgi:hypothetical protein